MRRGGRILYCKLTTVCEAALDKVEVGEGDCWRAGGGGLEGGCFGALLRERCGGWGLSGRTQVV